MLPTSLAVAAAIIALQPSNANAHGALGEDVKNMQAHVGEYETDLRKTISKYETLVNTYTEKGGKAVDTGDLLKFWEDAKMHYPVELNFVQHYAKIWQGIYAIKEGIDAGKPGKEVQASMTSLRETLWQGLGAVKLAAHQQANNQAAAPKAAGDKHDAAADPVATLAIIKDKLDRIMAKSAERDFEEAKKMVHATYLNLFEGVEGGLIEQDAKLVADLEKDFNVTLPKLIEGEAALAEIKKTTEAMKAKIAKASELMAKAAKEKKDAF
ncbi:hypothetical protein JIN77_10045 [Verrucomicrobiaceae bacterium R5-34]|nr:hypothetical protein [Verrucomicrobiaceae bacterium R5-34]